MALSISSLVFFYRRRLRARRVQELLALVGIAVGVALLYSVQVSSTSLSGSVEHLTEGLFGRAQWQLVARSPDGFAQRTVRMLARNRDVRAAVPVIEVPASVTSRVSVFRPMPNLPVAAASSPFVETSASVIASTCGAVTRVPSCTTSSSRGALGDSAKRTVRAPTSSAFWITSISHAPARR